MLNQKKKRNQSYPISKRMNTLLRQEPLPRDEDGAIEFWWLKMEFESGFPKFCILVNSIMDRSLTKRRRAEEKRSVLY